MADQTLPEPISLRVEAGVSAALVANAKAIGSTKDIVLRELIRAFNDYCASGRRPTFPFVLASPGYVIEAGRVHDATPGLIAAEEPGKYILSPEVKTVAQEIVKGSKGSRSGSAKRRSKTC